MKGTNKVVVVVVAIVAGLILCFKPVSRCLLFFRMNSRQENSSKLSFYRQNYN